MTKRSDLALGDPLVLVTVALQSNTQGDKMALASEAETPPGPHDGMLGIEFSYKTLILSYNQRAIDNDEAFNTYEYASRIKAYTHQSFHLVVMVFPPLFKS